MLIETKTSLPGQAQIDVQSAGADTQLLRDILKKEGIITRHRRGDLLVEMRGRADRVYLIERGFVAETCVCASGKRQVLDFGMDGDILMPMNCDSDVSTLSVEVLADTVSHMMSVSSFQRFAMESMEAMCAVNTLLRGKLRRSYDRMSNIGCRQGRERIRHLLLSLFDGMDSAGCNPGNVIPLRQVDLADAAGVTTVYVNQILKKFEAEGAIGLQKGAIIVRDVDVLRGVSTLEAA